MGLFKKLFNHQSSADQAPQRVATVVTTILRTDRLLGEVLLQLPRHFDSHLQAVVALSWRDGHLYLEVNPQRIMEMRQDDARILLEHEALHVIWRHPARYADHPHPKMVRVATDVAVNQYLPKAPAGTATLSQLRRLLLKRIPAKLDSQDYLSLLERTTIDERERLRKGGIELEGKKQGTKVGRQQLETHAQWRRGAGNTALKQGRLRQLQRMVKQAWAQTPHRDRGLLPGEIRQELTKLSRPTNSPDWRLILRQQLGQIAAGKEGSRARFNRRQPLRMDLPGEVTHLVANVLVFVDNSGSVTDQELALALGEVTHLAATYRAPVTVYSFDAKVYPKAQKLHPGGHLAAKRTGGGGTRFQSIFDYLHAHHLPHQGTVIIIITDGWGETTLRDFHYRNVFWLLTTAVDQLSVPVNRRRVFKLKGGFSNDDDNS